MAARNPASDDPTFDIRDEWALLADQPTGRAGIDDRTASGTFASRERDDRTTDLRGMIQTAIGDAHDIVAAIWEGEGDGSA